MRTICAATLALMFGGSAVGQSQQSPPCPFAWAQQQQSVTGACDQNGGTDARGGEDAPVFVKQVSTDEDRRERDEIAKDREQHAANERKIVVATIVLAVITGILAAATIGLWFATWDLFRGAERTSRAQLRAYVSQWAGDEPEPTTGGYIVNMAIRNGGVTPAFEVRVWSKIEIVAIENEAEHVFDAVPLSFDAAKFSIFPHSEPHHQGTSQDTSYELRQLYRMNAANMHLRGVIRYKTMGDECSTYFHLYFVRYNADGVLKCGWRYFEKGRNEAN